MPRKPCPHHDKEYPCSCGMGNLYRFVEPLALYLLYKRECSCGYDIYQELREHALTDAEIDKAALYRTLRTLEANGNVKSTWEKGVGGPARRVYCLTKAGELHLEEWLAVMENMAKSMNAFVREGKRLVRKKSAQG